jgi:hypothetical protein
MNSPVQFGYDILNSDWCSQHAKTGIELHLKWAHSTVSYLAVDTENLKKKKLKNVRTA